MHAQHDLVDIAVVVAAVGGDASRQPNALSRSPSVKTVRVIGTRHSARDYRLYLVSLWRGETLVIRSGL